MILDDQSEQSFDVRFFDSLQVALWGRASWNLQIEIFTAYSSCPIELKLGKMKPDINPHKCWIFRFPSEGRWGRLLKSSNRSTACSFHPIELKLDSRILNIRLNHILAEQDFHFLSRVTVGAHFLQPSNHHCTAYSSHAIGLNGCRMITDISSHNNTELPSAQLRDETLLGF